MAGDEVSIKIAFVPVMRSGLGMVDGFIYAFPNAQVTPSCSSSIFNYLPHIASAVWARASMKGRGVAFLRRGPRCITYA